MNTLSLEEIQGISLDIMKDIDRVCRKHGLKYTGIGGTLIGAVRHHGFIPWDDDIDIFMPRSDYEKFTKIYPRECAEKYRLFSFENDKDYYYSFLKVCDKTTQVEEPYKPIISGLGVFVDIFPIDNLCRKNYNLKQRYLRYLIMKIQVSLCFESPKKYRTYIKKIIRPFFAPRNYKYYLNKLQNFSKRENDNSNADYSGCFSNGDNFMYDKKVFETYIDLDFEDMKMMCIKEYDTFLKKIFGDYMIIPPENERVSHCIKAYRVEEKDA